MSTFIRAAIVTLVLNAGVISAHAGAIEDIVATGQIMHPYGTAGSK